jgi:hypothetical protein
MIKIKLDSYKGVANFLREEKPYMCNLILNSIKEGWKNKLHVIPIIEFHVNDNIIKVDVDETNIKTTLGTILEYYEVNEEYEKCLEIISLISDIRLD